MKYLIEMKTIESRLEQGNLIEIIEGQVFPSFDALIELQNQGKITGGLAVGSRTLIFLAEVDHNDALDEMLKSLPIWMMAKIKVTPLTDFGTRKKQDEKLISSLK